MNRVTFCLYVEEKNDLVKSLEFISQQTVNLANTVKHIFHNNEESLDTVSIVLFIIPEILSNDRDEVTEANVFSPFEKKIEETLDSLEKNESLRKKYRIYNFIKHLTQLEITYLQNVSYKLESRNPNILDFMKLRVLIHNTQGKVQDKPNCNHLQIDSTTIIWNPEQFYQLTFGATELSSQFLINAYGERSFSINCKVMFIPQNDEFTQQLKNNYFDHIEGYWLTNESEKSNQLIIYKNVFVRTMRDLGYLTKGFINFNNKRDAFNITKTILPCISQTWRKDKPLGLLGDLPVDLRALRYIWTVNAQLSIECNYVVFESLIKKHLFVLANPSQLQIEYESLFRQYSNMEVEQYVLEKYVELLEQTPKLIDFLVKKIIDIMLDAHFEMVPYKTIILENIQRLPDNLRVLLNEHLDNSVKLIKEYERYKDFLTKVKEECLKSVKVKEPRAKELKAKEPKAVAQYFDKQIEPLEEELQKCYSLHKLLVFFKNNKNLPATLELPPGDHQDLLNFSN